jgi:small subunit ribosomal protein S5
MARRGYVQDREFQEEVVDIKRVSKKTKGGDQMGFTALVLVGNKAGEVGTGLARSRDVVSAIKKAMKYAHRNKVSLNISGNTVVHDVEAKYGGSRVLIKPAPEGSGLIAGGAVRTVLDLAGVKDASAKMLGSGNKTSAVRCTIEALQKLPASKEKQEKEE